MCSSQDGATSVALRADVRVQGFQKEAMGACDVCENFPAQLVGMKFLLGMEFRFQRDGRWELTAAPRS